jgi:hypothetical protein
MEEDLGLSVRGFLNSNSAGGFGRDQFSTGTVSVFFDLGA